MKKKKLPSIFTGVRIPTGLREKAQKRAAATGRTLSSYIRFLIMRDLGLATNDAEGEFETRRKDLRYPAT